MADVKLKYNSVEDIENAIDNSYPQANETTNTWWVWDIEKGVRVDTNIPVNFKIRTGARAPASALGVKGEIYIDTSAWNVYEKTTSWALKGNIKGDPGGVTTVNGKAGTVILDAADLNAYTKSETAARDKAVQDDLNAFKARRDNPNAVTKAQVGLGNVANESKATMFASPTFTGMVTLPAAAPTADTQAAHKGYVDKKVADLVSSAPGALDTLNELAAALGDDPNFAATVATQIGGKVDKIAGKGLSTHDYDAVEKAANAANTAARHTHANAGVLNGVTAALVTAWNSAVTHIADAVKHITTAERTLWNTVSGKVDKVSGKGLSTQDYTSAEKTKLAGVAAGANNYVLPLVQTGGTSTTAVMSQKAVMDTIVSAGGGDMMRSVYDANGNGKVDIAENAEKVNGLTIQTAVPQGAKFTDTVYVHPATHPASMVTGLPTSLPANGGTSSACSGNAATATLATTARNIDGGTY